jgi:hypothetical protein
MQVYFMTWMGGMSDWVVFLCMFEDGMRCLIPTLGLIGSVFGSLIMCLNAASVAS